MVYSGTTIEFSTTTVLQFGSISLIIFFHFLQVQSWNQTLLTASESDFVFLQKHYHTIF